jgi:hypothetical protein
MRIIIRPVMDPQQEVDLTRKLVSAIAEELWRLYGGNEQLNWLEAERHLEEIVADARAEARDTGLVLVDAEPGVPANGLARQARTGRKDTEGRRNVRDRKPRLSFAALAVYATA